MKINLQTLRSRAIILGLLMLLSVTLAACVNTDDVEEILDTGEIGADISDVVSVEDDLPCAEGQTKAPSVSKIIHVETMKVAIFGECEKDATIKCTTPGDKVYETKANGTYYILEVDLVYETENNILKLTAQADGLTESVERVQNVRKNATAQGSVDGTNVSVGVNSRLYFDRMVSYKLFNLNVLTEIRNSVNGDYDAYKTAAVKNAQSVAQDVELIYVFVPNATTVYPEILPAGVADNAGKRYNQVIDTLSEGVKSGVTIINMYDVFAEQRDSEEAKKYGGIFRETDSNLTDYGSYLVYQTLMNHISAEKFPDAAPKALDQFTVENKTAIGGDLVTSRGFASSEITENIAVFTPKFLEGLAYTERSQAKLNEFTKFVDKEDGDYSYFLSSSSDDVMGLNERWFVETVRGDVNLPSAHIYRDNANLGVSDILAERFEYALFMKANDYDLSFGETTMHKPEDKDAVDYVIVFVSEDSIDRAFANEISKG